jgi:hypothetical protein
MINDLSAALLKNLLDALPLANIKPKRVLLQTGAKNYNVRLHRTLRTFKL